MRSIQLSSGERVPILGQGTCQMGERPEDQAREIAALRRGIELGQTFIDTAEIYGDGGAERVVGQAIAGQRDRVFLVTKVTPENAGRNRLPAACEASLKRLGTDHLDLYLLHWRGHTPLAEIVEGFLTLRKRGLIRGFGVSNFDANNLTEFLALNGAGATAVNQVLYNLVARGIEHELLPLCARRGICIIAYSPFHKATLPVKPSLMAVAAAHGASPMQIALAWLMSRSNLITIPKAAHVTHVEENQRALTINLTKADLAQLDRDYPRPDTPVPLQML